MATIRDVARGAGVSIATISRVFNSSARVSDETSRRVRVVAERMGYWPNGAARSLITKRTHALGVLLPELYGDFFSEVIRGIDLAARGAGYHLVVSSSHADTKELIAALRTMRGRIDGLVVMTPEMAESAPFEDPALRFPVVLVNPGFADRCSSISTDNVAGARAMVRHLAEQGHRSIAFIAGPANNLDARQRLQGYRDALRERGLASASDLELTGAFTESSGHSAARALLERHSLPDAVFCANDCMAVGALSAFREAGVRVPEDVAIAGFDDIAIASYLTPRLTTVRVDAYRLGERATQLLLEALEDPQAPGSAAPIHEVLAATLVVRDSTARRANRSSLGDVELNTAS
jgi:LacI family transcriptional regulator